MATEQVGVQSMQVTFYGAHSIDFDVRGVGGTGKIDKTFSHQSLVEPMPSHHEFAERALLESAIFHRFSSNES